MVDESLFKELEDVLCNLFAIQVVKTLRTREIQYRITDRGNVVANLPIVILKEPGHGEQQMQVKHRWFYIFPIDQVHDEEISLKRIAEKLTMNDVATLSLWQKLYNAKFYKMAVHTILPTMYFILVRIDNFGLVYKWGI